MTTNHPQQATRSVRGEPATPCDAHPRVANVARALTDRRGGEVVFMSHCLLNQHTRYLGGAACPGVVRDVVEPYVAHGVGIVQLPCPEQRTWGGVLKRRFLWLVAHPVAARARPVLLAFVRPYLRLRYRWLARAVVRDIADYRRSGVDVVGIVGVGGSPSCGATTTLDLDLALRALAARRRGHVTTAWMNHDVVGAAIRPGRGLFVEALDAELIRAHLTVPTTEALLEVADESRPGPA